MDKGKIKYTLKSAMSNIESAETFVALTNNDNPKQMNLNMYAPNSFLLDAALVLVENVLQNDPPEEMVEDFMEELHKVLGGKRYA